MKQYCHEAKKSIHLFPLDVANNFDLPTHQEQDAVVSYHFYRLLQRAKNIVLVYVSPSDTYGGKEKSRFIHQLENDLRRMNPKVTIRESVARFKPKPENEEPELVIGKNEKALQKIRQNFKRGLSPSQINSFINCSLQYYFGQIAEFGSSIVVEEKMGADKLGSLIHEILEEIFRELTLEENTVDIPDIQAIIPKIPDYVEAKFNLDKYANYVLTGQNYIIKKVTSQYILQFLQSQIEEIAHQGTPFEILSLENVDQSEVTYEINPTITASLKLNINDQDVYLNIRGITDRVDKVGEDIRIIDYKTSKVERASLRMKVQDLEFLVSDPYLDKVRQLWLYKYIFAKNIIEKGGFKLGKFTIQEDHPLKAGIYSLRNLKDGLLELKSSDKKAFLFPENMREYIKVSEEYLVQIISTMLDKEIPFEKTEDREICKRCNYKEICGRG